MSKKRKLPSSMYKKGQCVPRWLVRVDRKKFQHKLKFGCDVELVGRCVFMLTEGSGFFIENAKGIRINFNGIRFNGSRLDIDTDAGIKIGGI